MNHLRAEDAAADLEGGAAQQSEAYVVIGVIPARIAVEALAVVEFRAVKKVIGDRFADLVDAGGVRNASQPDRQVSINKTAFERNPAVSRQQYRDVLADGAQSRWKGADHIRESASLRKRFGFRGDHE